MAGHRALAPRATQLRTVPAGEVVEALRRATRKIRMERPSGFEFCGHPFLTTATRLSLVGVTTFFDPRRGLFYPSGSRRYYTGPTRRSPLGSKVPLNCRLRP
jgi:hypothetical protein